MSKTVCTKVVSALHGDPIQTTLSNSCLEIKSSFSSSKQSQQYTAGGCHTRTGAAQSSSVRLSQEVTVQMKRKKCWQNSLLISQCSCCPAQTQLPNRIYAVQGGWRQMCPEEQMQSWISTPIGSSYGTELPMMHHISNGSGLSKYFPVLMLFWGEGEERGRERGRERKQHPLTHSVSKQLPMAWPRSQEMQLINISIFKAWFDCTSNLLVCSPTRWQRFTYSTASPPLEVGKGKRISFS